MKPGTQNARAMVVLIFCTIALLLLSLPRLTLTYDLGFFLPPPTTDAQRVLIERLGQGPGTALIFAVLPNATEEEASQAAETLRGVPDIKRVLPETNSRAIANIPKAIWQNRLLLADLPESTSDWQLALDERLMDTMVADDALLDLIAGDPALTSVSALEQASSATSRPVFSGSVFSNRGERYLLIQTVGGAFDLDAQQGAVAEIRQKIAEHGHSQALLYGSGVYGVDLQSSIRRESTLFSILASVALAAVVFFRFRNLQTVLAVGIPLLVGGVAGLAVTALLFEKVHGITLAFGFTLLGVAIDYPLHLFSHAEARLASDPDEQSIWPTLALGICSTLVAYLAFVASGTTGMQQLGVFAATGISCAAVAAYFLSSKRSPPAAASTEITRPTDQTPKSPRQYLWLICVGISVIFLHDRSLFSDNLSEMTPVPKATLAADAQLRKAMGVADLRYLISVRKENLEDTLISLEHVSDALDHAVENRHLTSYQSVAALIPSAQKQLERRATAERLLNNAYFEEAVANSDFDAQAFEPFVAQLRATAESLTQITPESLLAESPELKPLINSLLYQTGNDNSAPDNSEANSKKWVALVFLSGLAGETTDSQTMLRAQLAQFSGAELIDLKQASTTLVSDYRSRVFSLLAGALVVITLLLLATTRNPRRVLWLLGTITGALGASLTAGTLLLGGLSLFDVIALALVAGLGLDYALFYSRPAQSAEAIVTTERAITLCALSSLLVFGILGFSSVPLLQGLGITVASGVVAAYLLARFGRAH